MQPKVVLSRRLGVPVIQMPWVADVGGFQKCSTAGIHPIPPNHSKFIGALCQNELLQRASSSGGVNHMASKGTNHKEGIHKIRNDVPLTHTPLPEILSASY